MDYDTLKEAESALAQMEYADGEINEPNLLGTPLGKPGLYLFKGSRSAVDKHHR